MTNSRLTDEDLDTLGALRRVGEPECPVTEMDGRYFYRGHPVVPWLQRPWRFEPPRSLAGRWLSP